MMWEASAPSNIALIKYMGKRVGGNIAINPSVSWTLDHLRTFVQIEQAATDSWEPHPQYPDLQMSETGRKKYLAHLERMKAYFSAPDTHFLVRSGNNFPADCGIASSASSFAALTLAAAQALSAILKKPVPPLAVLADLSRQGSGSSCRSFFPGFVAWTERGIEVIPSPYKNFYHQAVIISGEKKSVSSSQAHERVQTSLLMHGREQRAEKRFLRLCSELQKDAPDWRVLFEETWADFWDMHALFETSNPSFGYMKAKSLEMLEKVRSYWQKNHDGPLVTMDAGPNVHLLWRSEQTQQAREWREQNPQWQWIESAHDV